jgi:hypothetical protein
MRLTRRSALSLICVAALPFPLQAAACTSLVPKLTLCDTQDWRLETTDGVTATLIHSGGVTASVSLLSDRSEEQMMWDSWQAAHAPISARADVLYAALDDVIKLSATTTAYLPRHMSPQAVIVLTAAQGNGLSLRVSSAAPGETFTDQHRQAHAALLAALRLDQPE